MRSAKLLTVVILLLSVLTINSNAALISGQDIIAAPQFAIDDNPGAENYHMQAFDEAQDVILTRDIEVDDGFLTAGTAVSSHMIFLNTPGTTAGTDFDVVWEFDGEILGVMSDRYGLLEEASTDLLGAAGTIYPGSFNARGMENTQDVYDILTPNQISVSMYVTEPGDWIRVVTTSTAVPEPSALGLLFLGLFSLVGYKATRRKQ